MEIKASEDCLVLCFSCCFSDASEGADEDAGLDSDFSSVYILQWNRKATKEIPRLLSEAIAYSADGINIFFFIPCVINFFSY